MNFFGRHRHRRAHSSPSHHSDNIRHLSNGSVGDVVLSGHDRELVELPDGDNASSHIERDSESTQRHKSPEFLLLPHSILAPALGHVAFQEHKGLHTSDGFIPSGLTFASIADAQSREVGHNHFSILPEPLPHADLTPPSTPHTQEYPDYDSGISQLPLESNCSAILLPQTPPESRVEESLEVHYLPTAKLVGMETGLMLAMFVVGLDSTVLSTAIPAITRDFDSLLDIAWYSTTYSLAIASLQPTFGQIYTYWNVKYIYITAIVIFEFGSVLCATAKNSPMFIVGRTIAGCGSSGIFVGTLVIVGYAASLDKRPTCLALTGTMFALSSIIGPILGGVFTDKASWRWCFWINPPFGVVAIVAVFLLFSPPAGKNRALTKIEKIQRLDLLGTLLLIGLCICLMFPMSQGGALYEWTNARVWAPLSIGFPIITGLFIWRQIRRGDAATIPPRLIRQRTIGLACAFVFFQTALIYVYGTYLPLYFQIVQGVSAVNSGIRFIPLLVSIMIPAIVVAAAIPKLGYYNPFLIVGSVIACVGAGMLYTLQVDSGTEHWLGYQVLTGLGIGMCNQLGVYAIQVEVAPEDYPSSNALVAFFQTLSGPIVVGISQNILNNGLFREIHRLVPSVSPEAVVSIGTNLRNGFPDSVVPFIVDSYMFGIKQAFIPPIAYSVLTLVAASLFRWKDVRGKSSNQNAGVNG